MATTTTNLGLRKPENPDQVNVTTDIANNMQVIDDAFTPAVATNQLFGDTAVAGTALQAARADHKHGWPNFGSPTSLGTSISAGVASTPARSDHVHTVGAAVLGTPVAIGAAIADGVATTIPRSDHVHTLGSAALAPESTARRLIEDLAEEAAWMYGGH